MPLLCVSVPRHAVALPRCALPCCALPCHCIAERCLAVPCLCHAWRCCAFAPPAKPRLCIAVPCCSLPLLCLAVPCHCCALPRRAARRHGRALPGIAAQCLCAALLRNAIAAHCLCCALLYLAAPGLCCESHCYSLPLHRNAKRRPSRASQCFAFALRRIAMPRHCFVILFLSMRNDPCRNSATGRCREARRNRANGGRTEAVRWRV